MTRIAPAERFRDHLADRLSGRIVGQLSTGEQFLLWALRRRLSDGGAATALLVHGFRLAFGLARLEEALAAFDAFGRYLEETAARQLRLFPLRCPCLSTDEETILALVAGSRSPAAETRARGLVGPSAVPGLLFQAERLAAVLARAALDDAERSAVPASSQGPRVPLSHIWDKPKFSMPIFSISSSSVRFWS